MTFEQFKKSICDKDPQVKWALDLIDEEVKEALQQQREEMKKKLNTLRCDYPCDYDCVTCKTILRAIEIISELKK
jgi:hypothetical protein